MGIRLAVGLSLAVLGPRLALAACEPVVEGMVVTARDGALRVDAVVRGSPAARADVRRGDVVRQVNGARPISCARWATLVRAADDAGLELLVLTERGRTRRVVALAAVPPRFVVPAPSPVTPPPVAPPPVAPPPVAPPPVAPSPGVSPPVASSPAETAAPGAGSVETASPTAARAGTVSPAAPSPGTLAAVAESARRRGVPDGPPPTRAEVLAALEALGPRSRRRLADYRDGVAQAGAAVEALLAREPAAADADRLSAVLAHHEGARLAWEAIEAIRARRGLRTGMPIGDAETAPFFADSPVARLCAEVPALREVVARWPGRVGVESSGLWRPVPARRLLWAQADRLLGEVVGEGGRD